MLSDLRPLATRSGELRGAAVSVQEVTWRPYGRTRPVLDRLSLSMARGERVLLAGPSGSGKSTLLRAVAGLLLTADAGDLSGSVRVDGRPPGEVPGVVGLVLQDPGSGVVGSTVARDVAFGLENVGMPRAEMAAPVAAALAEVGLSGVADASPLTLSGGEQQRLALAGALAMSPQVLLLDEPTAMLDPSNAASVRQVVGDVVSSRGLTTVVVEHRLGPWLDFADRLVVLALDGSVLADGAPKAVLAARGAELVDAGIWVPGWPDPEPVALDGAFASTDGEGRVVERTRNLSVRLVSRPLNQPERVVTALTDVDVDVTAGRTVALLGPSGSGKSTLLTTLAGLVPPTEGVVDLAGAASPPDQLASAELARAVSWVPQRAATTIVRGTVRGEVLATADAVGVDPEVAQARASLLLDRLGLAGLADTDPRHLSGGEQRRLAVAAAVVHQPSVVLADEPTVGQDRHTWAAVLGILDAVRSAGAGVVVATHDDAVRARADTVAYLPARPALREEPPESRRRVLAARCGPLSLLMASLFVLPIPALVTSWRQSLVVLGVEVVLGMLALAAPGRGSAPVGRFRRAGARLLPALLGVLGVAWSTWLLGGHDVEIAVGAGTRVLSLVLPSVALLPYVDPDALGDHLAQRLHLPARPVVAATAALQRFQTFGALWSEITWARRIRGVGAGRSVVARGREAGATTMALLVVVLRQAAVLALAMDARGFAGAYRRTWAGTAPWRRPDTLAVLGGVLVVLSAAIARAVLPG